MTDHATDGLFDALVAPRYDATLGAQGTAEMIEPILDFLVDQARGGRVLEFAVGTGRIALPRAARGVEVHGIELSRAMLMELRRKAGGEALPVVVGDMATTQVPSSFSLVYLVYNTIANLLTQAEQVECFRNAARHLVPGGRFVIEVFVPELNRLPRGERYVPFDVSRNHFGIDEYDVANQRLTSRHIWVDGDRAVTFDTPMRYALPGEYDLMAQLAGMRLVERWGGWHRTQFTGESTAHVSVWEQVPGNIALG